MLYSFKAELTEPARILLLGGFGVLLVLGLLQWLNTSIAPLLLNARVERLNDPNLPRIIIEPGPVVYCRMKADDFRLRLPVGAVVRNTVLTGGSFDGVEGWVEISLASERTAAAFGVSLLDLPPGANARMDGSASRLRVSFRYFGDR